MNPCENCGKIAKTDPAHIFFNADNRKGKPFKQFVDTPHNLANICRSCHEKKIVDNPGFRKKLILRRLALFGYDYYRNWLDSFPYKKTLGPEWKETNQLLEQAWKILS